MTTLERLQVECRFRQLEKFRKAQKVIAPPPIKVKASKKIPVVKHKAVVKPKVVAKRKAAIKPQKVVIEKPIPKVDIAKLKEFNKKTEPIDVEQIREYINSKKQVDKVYPSAFSDKRDATRPPAKYSNKKAIDDYNPF